MEDPTVFFFSFYLFASLRRRYLDMIRAFWVRQISLRRSTSRVDNLGEYSLQPIYSPGYLFSYQGVLVRWARPFCVCSAG